MHNHDHDHHHAQDTHAHHGGHSHAPMTYNRAFAIGIGLNMLFVIVEAFYGWQAHSLALLADAGHNLSDVLSLLLAWSALAIAKLHGDDRHTYGWRRSSLLAALLNAIILLVAMGAMAWEAIERLKAPPAVAGTTMMVVASIGVVINGLTAWLFMRGSEHDVNIRGAFLHMLSDALVSLGVVVAGFAYVVGGWAWLDPAMSLLIAGVIVVGTWGLLKQSVHLTLDGVPTHIDLPRVKHYFLSLPHVTAVHDLHIWAMSSSEVALTVHLVMPHDEQSHNHDTLLQDITHELRETYHIHHPTIQIVSHPFTPSCQGETADNTP